QGDRRTSVMQAPRITLANHQNGVVDLTENYAHLASFKVVEEKGQLFIKPDQPAIRVGTFLSVVPVVSADRQFVRLDVEMNLTEKGDSKFIPVEMTFIQPSAEQAGAKPQRFQIAIEKPSLSTVEVKQRATVPDGRTVLMYAGKLSQETRSE